MKLNEVDLNKMAVFMEVARLGGITKAADKLSLTPSAVSQSIKALEETLGVTLFDRVGKSFTLSPRGSLLYQNLRSYQDGLAQSIQQLTREGKSIKGQLRLGVFYGFSNALIADFLTSFSKQQPDIEIEVLFAAPSELDRMLSSGKLDFAINLFRAGKELNETSLMVDELWLVSSQKPPRRALDLAELRKAPFIDYYRHSRLVNEWMAHHFSKRLRGVPVALYASHSELVMQLIMKGLGIGIVASSIAKAHVEAGRLFVIRGRRKQLVSPIWLKHKEGGPMGEARTLFKRQILAHFAQGTR